MTYFDFADYIRFQGRFVFEGEVHDFLSHIAEQAQGRIAPVSGDSILYRAQLNRLEDCRVIYADADPMNVTLPPERMMPDPQLVGDGRLSPRGIAYLYAADSPKTAVAEMRPYKSAAVTVATLRVRSGVAVVDLFAESEAQSV